MGTPNTITMEFPDGIAVAVPTPADTSYGSLVDEPLHAATDATPLPSTVVLDPASSTNDLTQTATVSGTPLGGVT